MSNDDIEIAKKKLMEVFLPAEEEDALYRWHAAIEEIKRNEAGERECLNCEHFRLNSGLTAEQLRDDEELADCDFLVGRCRRHPPVFVGESVDDAAGCGGDSDHWVQPAVAHCDVCGEFKMKEQGK